MKKLLLISTFLLSPTVFADYQCAGGKEACKRGREIYRLERITGESCSGGHEACLEYLQSKYDDMVMEKEIREERLRLSSGERCVYFYEGDDGEMYPIYVCN